MTITWSTYRFVGNLLHRNETIMFDKLVSTTLRRCRSYEQFVRHRTPVLIHRRIHSGILNNRTHVLSKSLEIKAALMFAEWEIDSTKMSWNLQHVCRFCSHDPDKNSVHSRVNDFKTKQDHIIKDAIRKKKEQFLEKEQQLRKTGQTILQDIRDTKEKMRERMEVVIERENIWTIPNILCVGRIVASPFLGYLILQGDFTLALALFGLAGVTDMLDGWIARNFNQSSKLGSFLDPLSDKILVGVLFTTLTIAGHISVALTALIIARDLLLVGAGFYIRYKSLPPPRNLSRYFDATLVTAQLQPTLISKVNTVVQLILVAAVMAAPVWNVPSADSLLTLSYITAATTIASGLSYVLKRDTYHIFTKRKK